MSGGDLIKVLIADDHDMVRHSFTLVLSEIEDITIIGEAKSGEEAVQLAKQVAPDIVLMDVRMPGIGGLEATKRIVKQANGAQVIGLSGYNDGSYPGLFMRAGARGYITKEGGVDDLVDAIRQVHRGEAYLATAIAQEVAQLGAHTSDNLFDELSEREHQIAMLLVECYTPQDIVTKLSISLKSVNSYRFRLFEKLDIASDVELTLLAIRHGIITPETALTKPQKPAK